MGAVQKGFKQRCPARGARHAVPGTRARHAVPGIRVNEAMNRKTSSSAEAMADRLR